MKLLFIVLLGIVLLGTAIASHLQADSKTFIGRSLIILAWVGFLAGMGIVILQYNFSEEDRVAAENERRIAMEKHEDLEKSLSAIKVQYADLVDQLKASKGDLAAMQTIVDNAKYFEMAPILVGGGKLREKIDAIYKGNEQRTKNYFALQKANQTVLSEWAAKSLAVSTKIERIIGAQIEEFQRIGAASVEAASSRPLNEKAYAQTTLWQLKTAKGNDVYVIRCAPAAEEGRIVNGGRYVIGIGDSDPGSDEAGRIEVTESEIAIIWPREGSSQQRISVRFPESDRNSSQMLKQIAEMVERCILLAEKDMDFQTRVSEGRSAQ